MVYISFMEGKRLYLRPILESDINANYIRWLNDQEVNYFSGRSFFPTSEASARSYLQNLSANQFILAICTRENKHIGNIMFGPVDWIHRSAEISILIGDKLEWRKGYAKEAIYLVSKHLFKTLGLHRVEAGTVNPAFARVVEKLGWKKEGELRQAFLLKGNYVNVIRLSLLNHEFIERPDFEL